MKRTSLLATLAQRQTVRNRVNVNGNNASQTVRAPVSITNPRQVATAFAAPIPPTTVCAGSTSAGAQGVSFGLSFGSSRTDQNCMLLEQDRTASVVLGQDDVAQEMMCSV